MRQTLCRPGRPEKPTSPMEKVQLTPYVVRRLIVVVEQYRRARLLADTTKHKADIEAARRQGVMVDRLLAIVDRSDPEDLGRQEVTANRELDYGTDVL